MILPKLKQWRTFLQSLSPNFQNILSNISWLLAERILRMGIGFFVAAWVARYLGAEQFGLLNYAIAFFWIIASPGKLGLTPVVFRDLVNEPEKRYEILGTACLLTWLTGLGTFLIVNGANLLLRPDDPLSHIIVAIVSLTSLLPGFFFLELWFQSQVQSKFAVWAKNSSFILITLAQVICIQQKAPLIAFAWLISLETILSGILLLVAYQWTGQNVLAWRSTLQRAKSLLKVSWPLIFSDLAIILYLKVDQVMLGQLADNEAVGIYAAAVKISESFPFLATVIVKSIAPSIIAAKKVSESVYYEKIQKSCTLLTGAVYCVAIPMIFLATPLVVFVFGPDYAIAGPVLIIHIWSSLFVFMGYVKEVWIVNENLTQFALIASVVGAIMNILLNFWLIPPYREMGAAIATVISYGFADYIMCLIYPPARPFGWIMTKAIGLHGIRQLRPKS